jgi:molybdopterin-biosynthesis enzyme MoeA-like protein
MKIAKVLKPSFKVSMTRVDNKRIKVFQVSSAEIKPQLSKIEHVEVDEEFEMDEFEDVEPIKPKVTNKVVKKATKKSKSTIVLEKKIAETNFQYQQKLEEDIGKQVNDLQEKYPNINLIEKYRYQRM